MAQTRLVGSARVRRIDTDGTLVDADDNDDFSVINCFANSLFRQVECQLNGTGNISTVSIH